MDRRHRTWRQRMARWLDPTVAQWEVAQERTSPAPSPPADDRADQLWPAICEQFAMRVLASTYQMGTHLEAVEADEQDPGRLERLYRIDHANTRIRRHAENLQVLLGRRVEDADPQTVLLVDVVRAAASAIEHFPRVRIGHVVELGVIEFAADDVIRVLTELLDNATRFSPPTAAVVVSAYVTEDGSVLLRIEDAGLGVAPDRLPALNAMLAGAAPASAAATNPAAHLGLVVVAHLAAARHLRVTLTNRPSGGTTATVLIPGSLLCEVLPAVRPGPAAPSVEPPPPPPVHRLPTQSRTYQESAQVPPSHAGARIPTSHLTLVNGRATGAEARQPETSPGGLPRRTPKSVREDPRTGGRSHQAGPAAPHGSPAGPDLDAWPDETADFAAGVSDAQVPTNHPAPRGNLR